MTAWQQLAGWPRGAASSGGQGRAPDARAEAAAPQVQGAHQAVRGEAVLLAFLPGLGWSPDVAGPCPLGSLSC